MHYIANLFIVLNFHILGYQHYEFSFIKDLAEPSKQLSEKCGTAQPTEELLFDFQNELQDSQQPSNEKTTDRKSESQSNSTQEDLLSQSIDESSLLLDNLLSLEGPNESNLEEVPETGQDALLSLGLIESGSEQKTKASGQTSKLSSLLRSNSSGSNSSKTSMESYDRILTILLYGAS